MLELYSITIPSASRAATQNTKVVVANFICCSRLPLLPPGLRRTAGAAELIAPDAGVRSPGARQRPINEPGPEPGPSAARASAARVRAPEPGPSPAISTSGRL